MFIRCLGFTCVVLLLVGAAFAQVSMLLTSCSKVTLLTAIFAFL